MANSTGSFECPPSAHTRNLLCWVGSDVLAGFLVFLIALPLCLGIAQACRVPPIAGIWTAVLGGMFTVSLSNSSLTIKGPAAGLIVIVEGCIIRFTEEYGGNPNDAADLLAIGYPLMLGVGVVSGLVQVVLGRLNAGRLVDLVPITPVHGMLAAIGITIIAKQLFPMLGLSSDLGNPAMLGKAPTGEPIHAILALPRALSTIAWPVATVGLSSLAILVLFPWVKRRIPVLKSFPAPVLVLMIAVPLATSLHVNARVAIPILIPTVFENYRVAFCLPDFRGLLTLTGLEYVVLFALIGSIESLLSAKAIDMIDPWKRKTNMNRDLFAIGITNMVAAAIGALPMISEIVRSKANVDNGGRTKWANFFHSLFLLACVLAAPMIINQFPLAALAAMLVFTGFRLASPRVFTATWALGREQFLVFISTILMTLCTDLLIGIVFGIALKILSHIWHGASLNALIRSNIVTVDQSTEQATIRVLHTAVFSNWLSLERAIQATANHSRIIVDLTGTRLVDHSVMEKLHELETEFAANGKLLSVILTNQHLPLGNHPLATRKNSKVSF